MINICEVGPRDGLQNEQQILATEDKVELINRLVQSGIKQMEAVSFVNPKVVPQMADAEEVVKRLPWDSGVSFSGLVLSRSGLERALKTELRALNVVLATSDTFNLKNAKRTVSESQHELIKVIKEAKEENRTVTGVLGTVFGCPFEGEVSTEKVMDICASFFDAGCSEIVLADTTGLANPLSVKKVVRAFKERFENLDALRLHFHNTRGLGLANVLTGYQEGVRSFDSSIAGLGGCPFAPKAVGNVCTEDLVYMFHEMNVDTETRLDQLISTSKWMEGVMKRPLPGMVAKT